VRWSGAAHGLRHVVQLVTTVVLVALLEPTDFGLVSMATVFVTLAALIPDLGTATAIVRRRRVPSALLSSVFWLNVTGGFVAAALVLAAAPLVARLYGEPRVGPILGVLSLTFVVSSASVVHVALLRRRLAFRALARVEIWAAVLGAAAGIGAAASGAGVWSLVAQSIAGVATRTAGAWIVETWRPRLVFSWRSARRVLGFGLNLTGFSVFNHFARHADYLLIGCALGAEALGFYTLAYRLMLYPVQNIAAVVTRVAVPVYARIQDDHARFRAALQRVTGTIAAISFPMMVGLMAVAEPLVATLFGPTWAPAAPLIVILAPVGLVQSVISPLGSVYQATGRAGLFFAWGVVMGAAAIGAFVAGLPYGVRGVAVAYAVVSLLMVYPSCAIPVRLIGLSVPRFLGPLAPTFLCSAAMGLVVAGAGAALAAAWPGAWATGPTLAALVGLGVATYLGLSLLFNRRPLRGVADIARIRTA
jgi:PST family polysaccharide transporter